MRGRLRNRLGTACAAALVLAAVATVRSQDAPRTRVTPHVEVACAQKFSFEPAVFKVKITTPGVRFAGRPTVRPFYGKASERPDSLTATQYGFDWDVSGAIRAARNRLHSTRIYLRWNMALNAAPRAKPTPMLTVISVAITPTGTATVAAVNTSAEGAGETTTSDPLPPVTPARPAAGKAGAAVCRLNVDDTGMVTVRVWVTGGLRVVGAPSAVANIGHAGAAPVADAPNHIDVTWTRPANERRDLVPVSVVLSWGGADDTDALFVGRTVLDLLVLKSEAGLKDLRTTVRRVPGRASALPPLTTRPAGP